MVMLKTKATNTRLFFLIKPIVIYRSRCTMSREKPMAVNMASCGETGPFRETGPEIFRKLTAESKKTSKKQKGPLLVFELHFSLEPFCGPEIWTSRKKNETLNM